MKVVLNNGVDFAELQMDFIPRQGDCIYYDEDVFIIVTVEYCIDDKKLSHVNLMLEPE